MVASCENDIFNEYLLSEIEGDKTNFTINLPYETGTFVKVMINDKYYIGTIGCYIIGKECVQVVVSGYKESWCYYSKLSEIEVLTNEEFKEVIR